ncbi:hypothetical protein BZL43_00820 [Pseudomonas sp. PICF141]|nr:hypothetical protein BZL43_00820 [Pseudomonas sp. PICF141]
MRFAVFLRLFAGKPRSYGLRVPLWERACSRWRHPLRHHSQGDFFEIRNDFALASSTRYITTVISSGRRK